MTDARKKNSRLGLVKPGRVYVNLISPEQLVKLKIIADKEQRIRRNLRDRNRRYDPLWPEDQYYKKKGNK